MSILLSSFWLSDKKKKMELKGYYCARFPFPARVTALCCRTAFDSRIHEI